MLTTGLPADVTRMRAGDAPRDPAGSLVGRVVGDFAIDAVIGGLVLATLMAGEEAAITLLMRLHTPDPLAPITELARTVAAVAVRAHVTGTEALAPAAPPRLAHRRPALRVIEGGAA